MKKIFTLIAVAMFFGTININAQCTGDRYKMQIFSGFDITSDILYGNNISYTGSSEDLTLDVYEPAGDTETNRPLMIICQEEISPADPKQALMLFLWLKILLRWGML